MRYMPGLVPVDFKAVGIIMLVLGTGLIGWWGADYLTGWFGLKDGFFQVGFLMVIVAGYLVVVVGKERD